MNELESNQLMDFIHRLHVEEENKLIDQEYFEESMQVNKVPIVQVNRLDDLVHEDSIH